MTDGLLEVVNNVSANDVDLFTSKTKSTINAKKYVEKVSVDFSWVDEICETIPYLDNIIRNPRRFIVQEEDVIRVEKVKKVTEESVKHLAQNTSLIQDVDSEGDVKPLKLLNVFREETIDLYENRFIYSLINNLYIFIQNQLVYKDEESFNKDIRTVNYEAETNFNKEDITLKLSLRSANYENVVVKGKKAKELEEKITYISDILEDFLSSKFMKEMQNATPVRSPIRKTNIILKDTNFGYALKLWEFLEGYNVKTPLKIYKETIDLGLPKLENNLTFIYYLNYFFLNQKEDLKEEEKEYSGLRKIIFDTAKDFDIDEDNFKKLLDDELKRASLYKEEQKNGIEKSFREFINSHNGIIKEALAIFK